MVCRHCYAFIKDTKVDWWLANKKCFSISSLHFCLSFVFGFIRMRNWEFWNFRILCIRNQSNAFKQDTYLQPIKPTSNILTLHCVFLISLHKKSTPSHMIDYFAMPYHSSISAYGVHQLSVIQNTENSKFIYRHL